MYFSLDPVDPRRRAKDALKRISKISMLIRRETPTTTLTNFDERLTYGDTDQNLRHIVNCIAPPSHAPCGGGDRPLVAFGAVVAPLALAIAAAALRRRIPVPTPTC